jgi:transposase
VSRPVVAKTNEKAGSIELTYREVATLSDTELTEMFSGAPSPNGKIDKLKEKFPYYAKGVKRPGVTLQRLWKEYLDEEPQGFQYSQFCYHYQQWRQDEKLSMHIEHKAGDKMFVDYSGKKLHITDRRTGELRSVEVFVAILPASQLTYAEAVENQNQESFVRSNERALRFFGGAPAAIVPDNL